MTYRHYFQLYCVGSLSCFLVACSSMPEKTVRDVRQTANKTAKVVTKQNSPDSVETIGKADSVTDVALTPLDDINVRKEQIPAILRDMRSPYIYPRNPSCRGLRAEINKMDALLGPDFDDQSEEDKSSDLLTLNTASSLVGSLIPFRGLVRSATGATRYDKEVQRAYRKGVARRGYLKGLHRASRCRN